MKKLLITAVTFVTLSTAAFADQNTENLNRMHELRMAFFNMTSQMLDDEIASAEMQMRRLSNYQRILKQMMDNESSSHAGK
jgi:hypothetical protein